MSSLYILIPLSLIIITVAVAIFFWAVKSGQYDDLDSEGERILFDEDEIPPVVKETRDNKEEQ